MRGCFADMVAEKETSEIRHTELEITNRRPEMEQQTGQGKFIFVRICP